MRRASDRTRQGLTGLLAASVALVGCASLSGFRTAEPSGPGDPVRPAAPAEYDVLVAQQFEIQGDMPEALAAYERAAAKDEDSAFLHRKIAEILARQNRLDTALYHATRAFELDPRDRPTRSFLGQLYRFRGDAAGAELALRDDSGEPFDEDAGFLLYQIYLEGDRLADAAEIAQWLIERDPTSLRGRLALANVYQRMDRPVDAERALREALEYHPGNLRIYNTLARWFRERSDRQSEIATYREVLEIHARHHGTLVALAEAHMADDDLEDAVAVLEEVEEHRTGHYPNL